MGSAEADATGLVAAVSTAYELSIVMARGISHPAEARAEYAPRSGAEHGFVGITATHIQASSNLSLLSNPSVLPTRIHGPLSNQLRWVDHR